MHKLILIVIGSGLGGALRYVMSGVVQRLGDGLFPSGTLAVNLLGCLLIGFLSPALASLSPVREEVRMMLLIGVLGGFTTFSTFGMETFALLNDGQRLGALVNVLASVVGGVAAVWLGYRLAERWLGV
jgi:CrcB protein